MEVCGFNDGLLQALDDHHCHKVILIQPEERKRQKTDRRDAAALSELLWVNRDRLLAGKPVHGLRQVQLPLATDQQNRRLTTLRNEAGEAWTRLINKIKHLLRRHNLQGSLPTKTFPTQRAVAWLKELVLPEIDRTEMTFLVSDLEHTQQRVEELEKIIVEQSQHNEDEKLLRSIPGVSDFTATSLVCRVGKVLRFPRARRPANSWGLTPGCRNSGEYSQRLLKSLRLTQRDVIHLVIDDTRIVKRGRKMDDVSKLWDHTHQQFAHGHTVVTAVLHVRGITLPWRFVV